MTHPEGALKTSQEEGGTASQPPAQMLVGCTANPPPIRAREVREHQLGSKPAAPKLGVLIDQQTQSWTRARKPEKTDKIVQARSDRGLDGGARGGSVSIRGTIRAYSQQDMGSN